VSIAMMKNFRPLLHVPGVKKEIFSLILDFINQQDTLSLITTDYLMAFGIKRVKNDNAIDNLIATCVAMPGA